MAIPFWDNSLGTEGAIVGPGADGPLTAPMEWDTCELQGIHCPGIVEVIIESRARRVQNKKNNGNDGATPTFRGLDPAKLTIRVTIWTPDQNDQWDAMLPIIYPLPNKGTNKLNAIDISHPATTQARIKSIIVEDVRGPMPGSVRGSKTYELKCVQFVPVKVKKSATKTNTGSAATTPAFTPTTQSANNPPPPSQTDFTPNNLSFTPAAG